MGELRCGSRLLPTVSRFTLPLRDLLSEPEWILPLKERSFEQGNFEVAPKFVARLQFLAAGQPEKNIGLDLVAAKEDTSILRHESPANVSAQEDCAVVRRRKVCKIDDDNVE